MKVAKIKVNFSILIWCDSPFSRAPLKCDLTVQASGLTVAATSDIKADLFSQKSWQNYQHTIHNVPVYFRPVGLCNGC